jgi:hypothetical protein
MRLIIISMELVIEDDVLLDKSYNGEYYDREKIASYLNDKLYNDPDFFDGFGPENIVEVVEMK